MNIFVLDKNPVLAAHYHCDKHVVKMIVESAQMMCTAHWMHNLKSLGKSLDNFKRVKDAKEFIANNTHSLLIPPYSMTHVRHPCTIWTGKTSGNYDWHLLLMQSLLDEYTDRYGKHHKTELVFDWLSSNYPQGIKKGKKTQHPQCMPEDSKIPNNPVAAYRNYYNKHKAYMAKWKMKNIPSWFKG